MKIGIDARLWNESGIGRYIRNLVLNLQRIDKKNTYILFVDKSFEDGRWKMEGGRWKVVRTNIHWHTLKEQFNFHGLLNKENLDLMHFPYFSVPIFYSKPFVVTIHDLIIDHFNTGEASKLFPPLYKIKRTGYKFVINQAIKKAQKIITVSWATKNEIISHYSLNENKITVIYEGVDECIEDNVFRKPLIKDRYLLYVGNAYPHKNLEKLFQAFFKVLDNKKIKNFKLVLVGREDYFYQKLKIKIQNEKKINSIVFYGQVNDKDLANLYKNAEALIAPSLMEGFGLPLLEAMKNKCLVLASDIPVFKEICGDSACYFNPKNVNNIAQKIEDTLDKKIPNQNLLIKNGLEQVKKFSWEKMARETLKIYESSISL